MGTWIAAIVTTGGRAEFWDLARAHGVTPRIAHVPATARIDAERVRGTDALFRAAEALSGELAGTALAFAGQSAADVYDVQAFACGSSVRRLTYSISEGGWHRVEGVAQAWEPAFFFDGRTTADASAAWPEMLGDEISDADIARFEAARVAGDPSSILDLLGPSSLAPLHRLAAFFGVDGSALPDGTFRAPSTPWLGRLLGRTVRRS